MPVSGVCLFMVATHKLYGIYSVINSINSSHISGFVYGRFNASVIFSCSFLYLSLALALYPFHFIWFGLVWFVFICVNPPRFCMCFIKLNMLFKCHFQIETNVDQIPLIASPDNSALGPRQCVCSASDLIKSH